MFKIPKKLTRMKIAIHHRKGSFSDRWIEYCKENNISYVIVNCYDTNIIEQVRDCDALMWHHHHTGVKDVLFAKQLLFSLEQADKIVFPDFRSGWHFDDKLGQKYLLEALDTPYIPTTVFYDKKDALEWSKKTLYPKVWKLRGGAGGSNVRLVKNKNEAHKLIKKAFSSGFSQFNSIGNVKNSVRGFVKGSDSILSVFKSLIRLGYKPVYAKVMGKEIGYVYFQEFMPNNRYDNRIIVIGNKAFGIKRLMRKGDFKSSEFNGYDFEKKYIDERCVKIAFDISKKMNSTSIGFDFIFDENNNPVIAEMGFGFISWVYDSCPGYWTDDLVWHEGKFNPHGWMVDELINTLEQKTSI